MSEITSYVRFFHAASDTEALQVSVNNTSFVPELSYRAVSNYGPVTGGFATITLAGTRTRRIYLQKTLPFFLPIKYTVAVIQTDNGLDLRQMPDYVCPVLSGNSGCLRAANFAYGSGPLDFFLYGNKLLFADVSFKEVTPFKPIHYGEYGFFLTPSQDEFNPLLSVLVNVEAGQMSTMCVLNGSWQPEALDVVVLDYDDSLPIIEPR